MAAVHVETRIRASAQQVWQALAATGEAHRAFAGVLKDCRLESEDLRIATFANGMVVTERIVSVEPERMRFAYSVLEKFVHHSATMQVVARGANECDFVWIADVLPHAAAASITPLMEQGAKALRAVMERKAVGQASA
ncbi:MAG TPA: SRPBCC family protein [Steroidobacteraceae bacterium]|jgi:uncharacterized protein YndB with AHSA1/START domain|nr:SRPBCC family protein [Steroidobacteraceae bacterium]